MKHYVLVKEQNYMDEHPYESLYVTEDDTETFIASLKEALKCSSTYVSGYREPDINEMFSSMMSIIDSELSDPQPDSDQYLEGLLNTFDEVFEDHQKTTDLWDYVRFANKRDEDVDNYLASQGLI